MNQASRMGAILSAAQTAGIGEQLVPSITVEEVSKRFAAEFDPAVSRHAVLPASADVPTEAALLEIGTKALAVKPERDAVAGEPRS